VDCLELAIAQCGGCRMRHRRTENGKLVVRHRTVFYFPIRNLMDCTIADGIFRGHMTIFRKFICVTICIVKLMNVIDEDG